MRLIDADALNSRIERMWESRQLTNTKYKTFIELLDAEPTIEPEQGEWIVHFDDLFPAESTEECSICHAEQLINGNDDNFCPNCGARMEVEDERD